MKYLIASVAALCVSLNLMAGPACCALKEKDASAAAADAGKAVMAVDAAEAPKSCALKQDCDMDKDCATCPMQMKAMGEAYKKMQADAATTIDTSALKQMVASKHPMVILDARVSKYDNGQRIPGAQLIGPDPDADTLAKLAPSKDALIVTYCGGLKCPLSGKLATKLRSLGYQHVVVYKEGISGWVDAGNEVATTN